MNTSRLKRFTLCLRLLVMLPVILLAACRQTPREANLPVSTPTVTTNMKGMEGPQGFPSPIFDQPYPGTGIIKIINRKEGWISIDHEEIKGLMPAMEMEFLLQNRSLVDNLKVGDRVDFVVVETRKGEYVTKIRKTRSEPPA